MLKKLFVTAAAAAAVSVPFAGAAWAAPGDSGSSNGNGIGQGGIPQKAGSYLNNDIPGSTANPNWSGQTFRGVTIDGSPLPPGKVIREAAQDPGNVPDAYGALLTDFYTQFGYPTSIEPGTPIGRTVPGQAVKLFTPGCTAGALCVPNPAFDLGAP